MDEIIIVKYDPRWELFFELEAKQIRQIIPADFISRIEHFGSTAVPGLAAKPIIDLLIEVSSLKQAKQIAVEPLESLGYAFWRDNPNPLRMFFVKGLPPNSPRTHHIHLVESDSILWERLVFRDYLRQHLDEAWVYEQLKRNLAEKFKHDREAYTAGKAEYIKSVMLKARQS